MRTEAQASSAVQVITCLGKSAASRPTWRPNSLQSKKAQVRNRGRLTRLARHLNSEDSQPASTPPQTSRAPIPSSNLGDQTSHSTAGPAAPTKSALISANKACFASLPSSRQPPQTQRLSSPPRCQARSAMTSSALPSLIASSSFPGPRAAPSSNKPVTIRRQSTATLAV